MTPTERDLAHLWDMLAAARETVAFMAGSDYNGFMRDRMMLLAVERTLGIIGEASTRVSPELRAAHAEIPWSKIKGLRNVLAHEYENIDYRKLFKTATEDVPALILVIEPIVNAALG